MANNDNWHLKKCDEAHIEKTINELREFCKEKGAQFVCISQVGRRPNKGSHFVGSININPKSSINMTLLAKVADILCNKGSDLSVEELGTFCGLVNMLHKKLFPEDYNAEAEEDEEEEDDE